MSGYESLLQRLRREQRDAVDVPARGRQEVQVFCRSMKSVNRKGREGRKGRQKQFATESTEDTESSSFPLLREFIIY